MIKSLFLIGAITSAANLALIEPGDASFLMSAHQTTGNEQQTIFPDSSGLKIFYSKCMSCHQDGGQVMAPGPSVLAAMTPRAIYSSLSSGKMRQQGGELSDEEKKDVAEYLTRTRMKTTVLHDSAFINPSTGSFNGPFDHSGWGNNSEGTGYRTTEEAGISEKNVGSLKLKWAFAFPDGTITRTKPAIAGEWLIVGSQYGQVYALNRHTGKIGWQFTASAAIRGAITILKSGKRLTAYFADYSTNVYAVDVTTGKLKWNTRAGFEAHSANTGSVIAWGNKLFVPIVSAEIAATALNKYDCCSSSGGVVALDVATGARIWTYRILPKAEETVKRKNGTSFYGPSGAPVWCSPTIDASRGLLYIGTGQNYSDPATTTSDAIQAVSLQTGKLVWNFQATTNDAYNIACPLFLNCPSSDGPDLDFGMAPIIVRGPGGNDVLLAGQKSGVVYALTPGGKLLWKTRIGKGGKLGGIHWGMATDGKNVYAANADNPYALDLTKRDLKPSPGLYALNIKTGDTVWIAASAPCPEKTVCLNGNSAAPLVIPGVVFAGSLSGKIRAYSSNDGRLLWEYDTVRTYESVNGLKGRGGSIDGPPPVVADGMLYVDSGYGMFGQAPGNVLLAFEAATTL